MRRCIGDQRCLWTAVSRRRDAFVREALSCPVSLVRISTLTGAQDPLEFSELSTITYLRRLELNSKAAERKDTLRPLQTQGRIRQHHEGAERVKDTAQNHREGCSLYA